MNTEQAAVLECYARHDHNDEYEKNWGYGNPIASAYWSLRDELVFPGLAQRLEGLASSVQILEIGSGHGHELAKLTQLGIPPEQLTGIDLVHERLARARSRYPRINFSQQDATQLAFADHSFDLVCQFTCVMHGPSIESQRRICSEMARVLKPGGVIVWWDMSPTRWRVLLLRRLCALVSRRSSLKRKAELLGTCFAEFLLPARRKVAAQAALPGYIRAVARQDLPELFPGLSVHARSAGLDFAIWESLWPRWPRLAQVLWRAGWLSHHCFAIIEKNR
jgi:SAM-dependent methyltransferase